MELPARHQNDINKQVSNLGPLVLVPSFQEKMSTCQTPIVQPTVSCNVSGSSMTRVLVGTIES
jgi:hypothetical protein